MKEKTVYTLGTDRRSEEDFIEILNSHGIECVIDIRRFPTSKLSHFKKESLEASLRADGIKYFFMGEGLGGYRKGGYASYVLTPEFSNEIDKLIKIIETCLSAIICAEKFPWKCHRRWIARALRKKGWRVIHIIEKDRVWIPE